MKKITFAKNRDEIIEVSDQEITRPFRKFHLNGDHKISKAIASLSYNKILKQSQFILYNLLLITLGSIICAVAVNGILIPHKFLSAGFTGLSLIIFFIFSSISLSVIYVLLNIPLFILGWKHVSRRFFLYSVTGVMIYTVSLQYTKFLLPVDEKILAALLAGLLSGIGSGLILKSVGSAGGLDILSVILFKKFGIRLGTVSLASNGVILLAAAFIFSLEQALYTLIYVYITSSVLNFITTGLSKRKAVIIVTPKWQEVSAQISNILNRGLTIFQGNGGYSGESEKIIYTVLTFQELSRLKSFILTLDPRCFMVVSDTQEVMGSRIGNQPHW
jgi:uncharacterized membrane-anchored protein YitT (DUF2179 family)